jgi:predicted RNA-binding protein with RPS1 domain
LAATATIGEVKKYIRQLIEEKKKKIHKPEIVSQAYVDRIHAELEILQMVMAEIYDIGRRKDLAKKYEQKEKEKESSR